MRILQTIILPLGALLALAACGELVASPQNGPYGAVKTDQGYIKPHTHWTQNWTPTPYASPQNPERPHPGLQQQPVPTLVYQAPPGTLPYPGPAYVMQVPPPSYPARPVQQYPVYVNPQR